MAQFKFWRGPAYPPFHKLSSDGPIAEADALHGRLMYLMLENIFAVFLNRATDLRSNLSTRYANLLYLTITTRNLSPYVDILLFCFLCSKMASDFCIEFNCATSVF